MQMLELDVLPITALLPLLPCRCCSRTAAAAAAHLLLLPQLHMLSPLPRGLHLLRPLPPLPPCSCGIAARWQFFKSPPPGRAQRDLHHLGRRHQQW